MVDIPHFAFPFKFDTAGNANVIEQDSDADVTQCVQVLLSTSTGSRVELPEYGIDDPVFTTTVDTQSVLTAIADWEPRADVTISSNINSRDELLREVRVSVVNGGDDK